MKRYTLEEVFKHVPDPTPESASITNYGNRHRVKVDFDGDMIKVSSDRLVLFKSKGVKCVTCGLEGKFFMKKKTEGDKSPHFNLYAIGEDGKKVLMTKDHIHPKSLGGKDCLNNYQPMCTKCNSAKGNTV